MNNKNKKNFLNAAIAFTIALALFTPVAAFANVDDSSTLEVNKIENAVATIDMAMASTLECQPRYPSSAPLDAVPIVNGAHPAIASDMLGNVVLGFESVDDPLNVWFTASIDGGQTWLPDAIGWQIPEPPELPDIDSCGDGRFIGGMVPNYLQSYGGELYKVEVTDPGDISSNGYDCSYWNFYELTDPNIHYYDFKSIAVGGYTAEGPDENTWAFGGHSIVGTYEDEGTGTLLEDIPLFSYQFQEAQGYAWIYTFSEEIASSEITSHDIDPETLYSYAVWNYDNDSTMDVFFYIFDFGEWDLYQGYPIHPDISGGTINTVGNDSYVDVSANNNNVIIVSQREGDVVAYYSDDGLNNVEETLIETGAVNPRIVHTGEDTATCAFIKDGSVYYSVTEDGGETWSAPEQVEDAVNVPEEYKASDVCGFGVAWMDQEDTIYFGGLGGGNPILDITGVKGGLGVSATVKNTGTADATNVTWNISVTGGLLGRIDKTVDCTIPSLAIGAESDPLKTGIFFGLGKIEVDVTVTCDEGASDSETKEGKHIIIFTLIK